MSDSTEDLDKDLDKMKVANDNGEDGKKPNFFKAKSSAFYHKVIKPAFPEAITDLKIMGVRKTTRQA